jgi:hypothetical protein
MIATIHKLAPNPAEGEHAEAAKALAVSTTRDDEAHRMRARLGAAPSCPPPAGQPPATLRAWQQITIPLPNRATIRHYTTGSYPPASNWDYTAPLDNFTP